MPAFATTGASIDRASTGKDRVQRIRLSSACFVFCDKVVNKILFPLRLRVLIRVGKTDPKFNPKMLVLAKRIHFLEGLKHEVLAR